MSRVMAVVVGSGLCCLHLWAFGGGDGCGTPGWCGGAPDSVGRLSRSPGHCARGLGNMCLCPSSPESSPSSCFSAMQNALSGPASRLMKD